jgi:hypothetical protein
MNSIHTDLDQLAVSVDLIEMKPYNTVSRSWISEIFQQEIRRFDGCLKSNTFPVFIVHGSTEYSLDERSANYNLFPYLSEKGHRFGLIHVMDEIYDHNLSVYYLDGCALVFREYYRPDGGWVNLLVDFIKSFFVRNRYHNKYSGAKRLAYEGYLRIAPAHILPKLAFMKRKYLPRLPVDKIVTIPLGFTDRLALTRTGDLPPINERKYKWSFCGDSFKSDRKLMLECLSSIKPNFVYEYRGFMGERSLSGEEYWSILTESTFVPCSIGNLNIDTYRLFEVLEAKAIPIVLRSHAWQPYDYYRHLLGNHPIPTFSSWDEAQAFVNNMDFDSIEELSGKVIRWYATFGFDLKSKIRRSISEAAKDNLLPHDIQCLDSLCSVG